MIAHRAALVQGPRRAKKRRPASSRAPFVGTDAARFLVVASPIAGASASVAPLHFRTVAAVVHTALFAVGLAHLSHNPAAALSQTFYLPSKLAQMLVDPAQLRAQSLYLRRRLLLALLASLRRGLSLGGRVSAGL
ncbi:MAG: hypothetical protein KGL04_06155 [Elusimicrobia bacterium]|nr:hypothetical protein [Elusimicrobiota bacterium]MDE2313737.1 hypothetical protein [Elusimicrobiota bacterium]